jgi:CheY-like chemotaxis protein
VAGARDAERLLQLVGVLRPDVVLADIRMPPAQTTEGLQAARQIRQRWPGTAGGPPRGTRPGQTAAWPGRT